MYWEFWVGGLGLISVALCHWFLVGRMMAVSGRFTVLVNRLRFGKQTGPTMTAEQLMAAMREATQDEFGDEAVEDEPVTQVPLVQKRPPQTMLAHMLFLLSLGIGGLLASGSAGTWHLSSGMRSELFPRVFGAEPAMTAVVLLVGGALIGFGTRMAAGCTSGHGLCGVSRLQAGSLAATAAFFGAGIGVSVALRALGMG